MATVGRNPRIASFALLVLGIAFTSCGKSSGPGIIFDSDSAIGDIGDMTPGDLDDVQDLGGDIAVGTDSEPANDNSGFETSGDLPKQDAPDVQGGCTVDFDCNDHNECTAERCLNGVCLSSRINCNVLDSCLIDVCYPVEGCGTLPVNGCIAPSCANDAKCDDDDPCSVDVCDLIAGKCVYTAQPCDDLDPCTIDSCTPGVGCKHLPNGICKKCVISSDCDDGDMCTVDSCMDGACTNVMKVCDDLDPCTVDRCDPASGCKAVPTCVPCTTAGAVCDDGNPCTINDKCSPDPGGSLDTNVCVGDPVLCDDNNDCTQDFCSKGPGYPYCTFRPIDGDPCSDGDFCTENDACLATKCSGSAVNCDDDNPCTADYCDKASGCVHNELSPCGGCTDDAGCDDQNACTTDTCVGGTCQNETILCDDLNSCTENSCVPATGCSFVAIVPCPTSCTSNDGCNDNDVCTTDICSNGTCSNTLIVCNDRNPCTTDTCSRGATAYCTYTPNQNGSACNDGSVCTTGETCTNGTCSGTTIPCDDSDACTTDSCDPINGCTHVKIPGCPGGCSSAADCNDGDLCTTDYCVDRACIWRPVSCDDKNSCTTDTCVAGPTAPYCRYAPVTAGTLCDDGNACTTGDTCTATKCVGTVNPCDDNDSCTVDSCDPTAGCLHRKLPNCGACQTAADCSDGDMCTTDYCVTGTCISRPIICDDKNPCTTDSCRAGATAPYCSYPAAAAGTLCDDGNACTTKDTCSGTTCSGGTPVNCDDGDACTTDSCDKTLGCQNVAIPGCVAACKTGADCNDGNPTTCDCCCVLGGAAAKCYNQALPISPCPACTLLSGCT